MSLFPRSTAFFRLQCLTAIALLAGSRAASFVANPSFEANYNATWPHYSTITSWTGGSGINQADGPFHNSGTPIPDQSRVAFSQGARTLAQSISGLNPTKRYWVQYSYDARACCGGTVNIAVKWDGLEIDRINGVVPVTGGNPYHFRSVAFQPSAATGTLTFDTEVSGDATALFDAISIVQRDDGNLTLANPGFEASGDLAGVGYGQAPGWVITGGGINRSGAGTMADNGVAPDQDHVVFLQSNSATLAQTVAGLVAGENYTLSWAANARGGNSPHLQVRVNGTAIFEADLSAVGGTNPYLQQSTSFTAPGSSVTILFAQTAAGDQTLLLDDIRLAGFAAPPIPCLKLEPNGGAEISPGEVFPVQVTVDGAKLALGPAAITLRTGNVSIARFAGPDPETVTLLFPANQPTTTLSLDVEGVSRGSTALLVTDADGLCVEGQVPVIVTGSLVRNPSFENSAAPGGIGTGRVLAWSANTVQSGANVAGQAFWDNGAAPDRGQVAFIQGNGILSQELHGLQPSQTYWLQFYYNIRNCCQNPQVNLAVRLGGVTVDTISTISAAGGANPFYFRHVPFTAGAADVLLEFDCTTVGDGTVLLDAVTVTPRLPGEVLIRNPSFEASSQPTGVGYATGELAGWAFTGGHGTNLEWVGPFADNGEAPDQDAVLFMQNSGAASQAISGLDAGHVHTLLYSVNSRNCCSPGGTPYQVRWNGEQIFAEAILPVGGTEPYPVRAITFTPPAATGTLTFEAIVPAGQDHSLLLDDVRILWGAEAAQLQVPLAMTLFAGNAVRLSWPLAAPPGVYLEYSADLQTWLPAETPPFIDGTSYVVLEAQEHGRRFYRLRRP